MIVRSLARALVSLLFACAVISSPAVSADVITPPPDACNQSEDIGDIQLDTDLIPPRDDTCYDIPARRLRVLAVSVIWEPSSLPISVTLKRDRSGDRLFMTSMIRDPRGRFACWTEARIGGQVASSSTGLWTRMARAFDRWAATCPAIQTIGLGTVQQSFLAQSSDFRRAFVRLARLPRSRFGPPEEGVAVGSFLPSRISQGILDAVADVCAVPRDRLRLQSDGTIQFNDDPHLSGGADGSLSPDSCVQEQIRYFPGYRSS